MRLICANVNGVRAALRRGGLDWLAAQQADVITLQEVRADDRTLAKALAEGGLGDYAVAHEGGDEPGRAGVAVLSREPLIGVRSRLATGESGRWIEADIVVDGAPMTVVSAYVHAGEAETPRQEVKYRFLDAMQVRLAELSSRASRAGVHAVLTGDLNIARSEADIKNWKGNLGRAGFLEGEREYLDRWFTGGWVDLGRRFGGDGPGPYTWWSWRGKAFDNDAGWRIDYVAATTELAERAQSVTIGRAPSYAQRWSDHAPVVADFQPS